MGHTDPLLAIPAGFLLGLGALWVAIAPDAVRTGHGWGPTLLKYLPDPTARVMIRICELFTATICFWFVIHAVAAIAMG